MIKNKKNVDIKMSDKTQKTNIIYLTTRCNLECEYCYESNKRNQPDFQHYEVTKKQIDDFIEELETTEGEIKSTTIVIMGGEPTLAITELEYLIESLLNSSKKLDKKYYATFTTNGVLLNNQSFYDKLLKLFDESDEKGFRLELEISYDGIGQDLRPFPDGSSSKEIVESVIDKLTHDKRPFRISYTVSEKNWDKLVEEAILIFEKYPTCIKISFSFAFERLDQYLGDGVGFKLKKDYKSIMRELYKIYHRPICGLACGEGQEYGCLECDKSTFDGNRYLSPTKGILTKEKFTECEFGQF